MLIAIGDWTVAAPGDDEKGRVDRPFSRLQNGTCAAGARTVGEGVFMNPCVR
ncbi:hypothetical protein [Marilutibacter chinensis]|uniref:Uncharacterized protein n=1 Tax=Marilutibacter chinensis TaxID=2912247 RepID=A0ABS9HT55_9GAMM|nr:hypothetical protein [Lysobacter chinensis]MCF7221389.1 hypothetical protein [Lysobacter chinensis]